MLNVSSFSIFTGLPISNSLTEYTFFPVYFQSSFFTDISGKSLDVIFPRFFSTNFVFKLLPMQLTYGTGLNHIEFD